jgi:hypothetical protein
VGCQSTATSATPGRRVRYGATLRAHDARKRAHAPASRTSVTSARDWHGLPAGRTLTTDRSPWRACLAHRAWEAHPGRGVVVHASASHIAIGPVAIRQRRCAVARSCDLREKAATLFSLHDVPGRHAPSGMPCRTYVPVQWTSARGVGVEDPTRSRPRESARSRAACIEPWSDRLGSHAPRRS